MLATVPELKLGSASVLELSVCRIPGMTYSRRMTCIEVIIVRDASWGDEGIMALDVDLPLVQIWAGCGSVAFTSTTFLCIE